MFLRKIKDIRISNKQIAVVRDADISVTDLEDQISQIQYRAATDKKSNESENAKLPPFIQVFYFLFFAYLKIPSENDFWKTYLNWVGSLDQNGNINLDGITYREEGLKSRLNRTYPSLIRDLHFLYLLDSTKIFESVDYSMERDYYNGLDIKVMYKGKVAFVSLFIDTSRGKFYKEKKTKRHDYSTIYEIEFNVDFSTLSKKGDIYLLNQSHIDLLEQTINETT